MFLGQVGSLGRDVSAVTAADALIALSVLLVLSALAAWLVVRLRPMSSWLAWFGGFASLALIAAVTLSRDGIPSAFGVNGIGEWSSSGLRMLSRDPLGSSQFLLNVALFVPAGAIWAWLVERPLLVLAALGGMSLIVELLQGVTGTGAPDVADLVANSLGAALGVTLAAGVRHVLGPTARRMSPRRRRMLGAAAGLMLLAIVTAGLIGASQRQGALEDALRSEFAGTSRPSIEARLANDPNAVFGAVTDFADGAYTSETSLEIRYPASFFGLYKCVYVIWPDTGVEFQRATGEACTRSMDDGERH